MRRPSWRPAPEPGPTLVVLASVLLFLACLSWAAVTPAFRTPDELQHVNSVLRVADGGGWPKPGDARVRDELVEAWGLSGATLEGRRTVFPGSAEAVPGAPLFTDAVPPTASDRPSFEELADGGVDETWHDQMTQHPPGYYAAVAAVYDLAGAAGWRYDRALLLLRALTALTIAASVPVCCYVAARRLTGREDVGRIAAFVPLLVPELHFIGGGVNNDGATIAAASALWALLFTVMRSGPTRMRLLLLTVAMAAACWTKGTALSLLPCVPIGLALAYRRTRGPGLRRWALPAAGAVAGTSAAAFVLGGWWWALNLLRHGTIQPSGLPRRRTDGDVLDLGEYLPLWLSRIRWTFFGEIGGREPALLRSLTVTLAVVFLVLGAAGLASRLARADRAVVLLGLGLTVGALFATTYGANVAGGGLPGIQGRYLFVLLVPVAALVAAGAVFLAGAVRLPARGLLPVLVVAGPGVAGIGFALGFRVLYAAPGDSWAGTLDRFVAWSAWPPAVLAVLATVIVGCSLGSSWIAVRDARRTPVVGSRPEAATAPLPGPVHLE